MSDSQEKRGRLMPGWAWMLWALFAAAVLAVALANWDPPQQTSGGQSAYNRCQDARRELADLNYLHQAGDLRPSEYRWRATEAEEDILRFCQ